MTDKHRRRRDFIQNIVITVLAVSAVLLFAQTQIYSLGSGDGFRRLLLGDAQSGTSASSVQEHALPAPVRLAVSGPYGRYGSITASIGEDETLRGLLREVLGSTGTFTACGREDFLQSLENTSVYFDFLSPLPGGVRPRRPGVAVPLGRCRHLSALRHCRLPEKSGAGGGTV